MGSIVHRSVPTNLKWFPTCSHAHAMFQDRFKDVQVGSRWFSTLYILSPNFHKNSVEVQLLQISQALVSVRSDLQGRLVGVSVLLREDLNRLRLGTLRVIQLETRLFLWKFVSFRGYNLALVRLDLH